MPSIPHRRNVVCRCAQCSRNSQGYSLVTSRTAEHHIRKDELERIERLDMAERLANTVQEEQMMDVDTQYDQADSPDSNAATMADNVSVDDEISEVNGNDSDIERDMNSDSGSGEEEGVETDVEEFVNEDPFDAPNMPENPVHRFIATFAVLFISRYVVNKGAAVLIEFINQLLKIYGKDFQLPTSLIGLQKMTGFSNYANGIKKSVVCEDCHKVYEQDVPLPTHCDFKKHGSRSACNCELMKVSSSGAMVAKRSYVYNSIQRSLQLHCLGYFDLVRGTIIDPMHNLFLGTPKRMMERWIKEGLIDDRKLATMQTMAETMVVPMDYVVLKSKIGKGFPYMKADEWKSWVLVYSPILLKAVLPIEMFRNWISFVDACRQLVKPSITFSDIDDGHKFFQEFCTECQRIYTPTILTCNMHLHLHLRETICDFGPVYGYWLFRFERYNGLLKNVNTNRKDSFEVTYMNSFVQDTFKGDIVHAALTCPSQVPFLPLLAKLTATAQPSTSKNTITFSQCPFRLSAFIQAYSNPSLPFLGNEPLPPSTFPLHIEPPSAMSDVNYPHLLDYYKVAYCMPNLEGYQHPCSSFSFVNNQIIKLKSINLLGQVYKGCKYASGRGSFVQSLFLGSQGNNRLAYTDQIQYLFLHSFTSPVYNTELQTCVIYQAKHFQIEHDHSRELESVDICSADFIACDFECILPVHRISSVVTTCDYKTSTNNKKILVNALLHKQYN
ncbi:C2H2-type zinc finger transcription factor [Phycomyces blakesleeanus NRRL 1555(-)]|uniref:C2H2-type zinc finger transcription factor n=1 Tax=Phycomyces blakesleeanus (strain ATCC 8743b / DSM 1359 / FGSC 10004 / NBRC 33097 / NRRL 1555) TaxID=763407 RepID=A0A167KT46_PHYB8|nr:C2H2-type zinc finger transcription factor [Phycomyces blakesleeanus NRRL 1555(-)]OAD68816.1 C2H2-type zinc finger transcription factor [Phycomyces blakesleeanus NRRL 1555(-)]|eukprot:XP_018286856.1 C2H2-type zinc finger transcription factor [Phycomyces blakesleeanus NRRL 1555(-)]